jgi:hypothetical protein
MPPDSLKHRPYFFCLLAAATFLTLSAQADQTVGNDPTQAKDPGFFNRASNNLGNFFNRLFKTDGQQPPPPPAPSRSKSRSRGPRYNLDQPPAELRGKTTGPTQTNPDDSAPATTTKSATGGKSKQAARSSNSESNVAENPPKSKAKTQKSTASNTESGVAEEPPKPKTKPQKSAASSSNATVASDEASSRSKTKKPAEPPPGPARTGSGDVLYSNSKAAETKSPEVPPRTQTESAPTPPKAPAESPSVLTGSKTGKPGRVKSPYAPYSELDVTGLPSGSLALDPTTQKVFRIP